MENLEIQEQTIIKISTKNIDADLAQILFPILNKNKVNPCF
ncbi:hypothetical protein VC0101557_22070 [Vibrio cholerae VC0101557]|uniref:Uncharacterized protein n=2 Tax=Vibrio cholerae TaxID=666 RepID=Q9KS56_VIBCH|nr:hypothetical protein VC_1404 [Vibrio cholerae O1 biovar El Tor str. N16961]ACP05675.1 conserved hypothetical protein [Vibrio cholerae M66-2]APF48960.1 hypothetical protein ASZ80_01415 [Vibrio cholerae]EAZ74308.1 hypothetical protein A5C_1432 [Vibrio cholerae NCTC 8457]EAZ78392.1 hypothetical protein A5E_1692 [Vibrio cholerae B33]EGR02974.1 hypothetical protein VCHCUF01_1531 [Vibrio cholerae HCUF01]EGR03686.1 hypothetical protein VCHC49A2_2425 [Vibrio cholerae HC-49A2]EGS49027.1 hypothetic